MKALVIVLNETDYLDDILKKFVELGVKGATILDSQGMGRAIVHGNIDTIPMFASLRTILKGVRPYSKTIFTVIHKEELLLKTVKAVQELLESSKKIGSGFMFTVPVDNLYLLNAKKD